MEKQDTISKSHLATGRAVDQLRRQLGIVFQEDNGSLLGACPVESMSAGLFSRLQTLPQVRLSLLMTGARARSLGINTKAKAVRIDAQKMPLIILQSLADPLAENKSLPEIKMLPVTPSHETLMIMAKYASLLPALLIVESANLPEDWLRVLASDVATYWVAPPLEIVPVTEARLPIEGAENAKLLCFRTRYGTSTHLALVIGEIGKSPLVRVHSSCVTGDILGSLRCDCGEQLQKAVTQIIAEGSGIFIYLHQEGRGIGIANKLRAYALQERGIDTYEANLMLGFEEDERDFAIAAAILKTLKANSVRLMTNNPLKIENLEKHGIRITERIPLVVAGSTHSHFYLDAKAKKSGHLF